MNTIKKTKKNIGYYMNLPWTYTVETAQEKEGPIYIIRVNELPGVATDAPTLDEAMQLLKEAMHGLFEMYLEDGNEIPEPDHVRKYKGKITYRTSQERHYLLMREATKKDLSLSQILDSLVDKALIKSRLLPSRVSGYTSGESKQLGLIPKRTIVCSYCKHTKSE